MTLPLFPQYFSSINLSAIGIGLAFAAYGISFLIFEALWGFVYERYGIKGVMPPLAVVLTSVALLFFARPADLTQLLGIELLLGLGLGGAGVFPRLAIAQQAKHADRGRTFGMLGFTYSIGATLGSLLGGLFGSLIGISDSFVLTAAITFASFVPIWWGNRSQSQIEEIEADEIGHTEQNPPSSKRFNRRGIIVLGLVGLIAAGGNGFYSLIFPNILLREPRLSVSVIGISIVIATFNLSTGLTQPIVGSLGSRKPVKWIIGCLTATGLCYLFLVVAQNIIQVEIITIATGAVYAAITPLTLSLLTTFVPRGYWGRVIGLYGAAEDVGILVGASVSSFVWGIWGPQYAIAMMGLIYVLIGATCFLASKTGALGQESRSIDSVTG